MKNLILLLILIILNNCSPEKLQKTNKLDYFFKVKKVEIRHLYKKSENYKELHHEKIQLRTLAYLLIISFIILFWYFMYLIIF